MKAPFILVVIADCAWRRRIACGLQTRGYLVLTAGTFRAACDQLTVRPALLILDLDLPDAPGWDVAAWVESITRPVPLVVLSDGTPDAEKVWRFQPIAVVRKPVALHDLLAVVTEHVVGSPTCSPR